MLLCYDIVIFTISLVTIRKVYESVTPQYNNKIYFLNFLRKGYGPEDIAITTYLDGLREVPDLYLCSYYFSYFAFNM